MASNPFSAHVGEETVAEKAEARKGRTGLQEFLETAAKMLVVLYIRGATLFASQWVDGQWIEVAQIPHTLFRVWLARLIINGQPGWVTTGVLASVERIPELSTSYWRALRTGILVCPEGNEESGMFLSYWVALAILAKGEYPQKSDFTQDYASTVIGDKFREPLYKGLPASQVIAQLAEKALEEKEEKEEKSGRKGFRLAKPAKPANPEPAEEEDMPF